MLSHTIRRRTITAILAVSVLGAGLIVPAATFAAEPTPTRLPRHALAGLGPGQADQPQGRRPRRRLLLARQERLAPARHASRQAQGRLPWTDRVQHADHRHGREAREEGRLHAERRQADVDLPLQQLRAYRRAELQDGLRAAACGSPARWAARSCRSGGSGSASTTSIRSRTRSWSSRSADSPRSSDLGGEGGGLLDRRLRDSTWFTERTCGRDRRVAPWRA